jgi:hypothetical protein
VKMRFIYFIVVLGGGTLGYLQKFLQCIKYMILKFTPSAAVFQSPIPILRTVSTGIIFAFIYICRHYLHTHIPTILAEPIQPSCSLIW